MDTYIHRYSKQYETPFVASLRCDRIAHDTVNQIHSTIHIFTIYKQYFNIKSHLTRAN